MAIDLKSVGVTAAIKTGELPMVHPNDIYYDHEHNLSRHYDDDHNIGDLVASYEKRGKVLQPVRLVKVKLPEGGERLEIVCGTRRVRAAQIFVRDHPDFRVPAIIVSDRTLTPEERLLINIDENENREDPSSVDKAFAMKSLRDDHGYDVKRIAQVYGCTQNTVRNHLKLTEVNAKILRRTHDGLITMMDAIELGKVQDGAKVDEALNAVDSAHAEVETTEETPDGGAVPTSPAKPKKPGKGKKFKKGKAAVKQAIKSSGGSKSKSLAEIRQYLGQFLTGPAVDILKWVNGEVTDEQFYDAVLVGK